ncbi:MAG: PIN domain-containing protein [Burkholderiaceae bacterium]|nr:PIN domain-containing protein [Burkholderiaceae bacterium]MDH3459855.1 PIN domain-containing protein [Burkholderiaceae bacterium]
MIAIDTNILVYAHREDSDWHAVAAARVTEVAEGRAPWAIPWPCIHEFLAIVTHQRIFSPPTPLASAIDQVDAWMESPTLVLLSESGDYWRELRLTIKAGRVVGPQIHDARIAALCLQHGVRELWSADRDFGRFPVLRTTNPLATREGAG